MGFGISAGLRPAAAQTPGVEIKTKNGSSVETTRLWIQTDVDQAILRLLDCNVGLGTTTPAAADGSARTLQLGSGFVMQDVVGTQLSVSRNAHYDGTWKYVTTDTAQAIRMYSGDIVFHLASSGSAGASITNWDGSDRRMIIKNSGNVGIGTYTPGAPLDVFGAVRFSKGSQDYEFSDRSQFLTLQGLTAGNGSRLEVYTQDGDGTDPAGYTIFGVGVPTNVTNYEQLRLEYDSADTTYKMLTGAGGTGTVRALRLITGANTTQLVLATDGNVGIGAASPGAKLEVGGQVKITGGSPGSNKVLVSDAAGLASWSTVAGANVTPDALDFDDFMDTMTLDAATSVALGGFNLTFTGTGNLGIGTATVAGADGSARTVQIGRNYILQDVTGNQVNLAQNAHYDGAWKYVQTDTAQAVRMYGGDIVFHVAASGTAGAAISNWDGSDRRMIIKNSGNVGIGTYTPAAPLDVFGAVRFSKGSQDYEFSDRSSFVTLQGLTAGNQSRFELYAKDGDGTDSLSYTLFGVGLPTDVTNYEQLRLEYDAADTTYKMLTGAGGTGTVRALRLITGANTTQLVLATDGNVGIGAATPGAKLEVGGQVKITGGSPGANKVLVSDAAGLASWATVTGANVTPDALDFDDFTDTMALDAATSIALGGFNLTLTGTGNVGIGTATPSHRLDAVSSGVPLGVMSTGQWSGIEFANSAATVDLYVGLDNTGGNTRINSVNSKPIRIYTNSAHALTIDSSQNVGIGTTAPADVLDVRSSAQANARFSRIQATNDTGLYTRFIGGSAGATQRGAIGFGKTGTGSATLFTNELADSFGIRAEGALHLGSGGDNIRVTIESGGNVNVGDGTAYGDARLVVAGTNGSNDSTLVMVKRDGTTNPVFSVLPWDSQVYLGAGLYYSNGAWVHNSDDTNSQLFNMDPGNGVYWYASSDSSVSWDVASAVNLWNGAGIWKALVQSTASGSSYFTGGNVGIGSTIPQSILDIVGTTGVIFPRKADPDPTGVNGMIYYNSTNNKFRGYQNGAWTDVIGGGGGSGGWTDDGTVVRLTTSTDQVGVATATPGAGMELDVNGDARATNVYFGTVGAVLQGANQGGSMELGPSNSGGGEIPYIDFHYGVGSAQDYNIRMINSANNRLDISTNSTANVLTISGANVGIGSTAPTGGLTVANGRLQVTGENTPTTGAGIHFGNPSGIGVLLSYDYGGAAYRSMRYNATDHRFENSGTEYLRLTGGLVGLGTTIPRSAADILDPDESATQTNFTQALTDAGLTIRTQYADATYTPGVFWSSDNQPTKPYAGIYLRQTSTGTHMYFGTSNAYATGITNNALILDPSGNATLLGDGTISGGDLTLTGTSQITAGGAESTYSALTVDGVKAGWGGINFRSGATNLATLMVTIDYQGFYNNTDNGWDWYWTNGSLTAGTVPAARVAAGSLGSGNFTITGNLLPEASGTRDLGSSSLPWGSIYTTGTVYFTNSGTGNARLTESWGVRFTADNSGAPSVVRHHLSTSGNFYVGPAPDGSDQGTGNLLVGVANTRTGTEKLKVSGGTGQDIWINIAGSSDGAASDDIRAILGMNGNAYDAGFVGTATNHKLHFRTNNTDRMTLDTSGNLDLTVDATTLRVPRKAATGDPAGGANGMIYYNTADLKFRAYQNGGWTDLIAGGGGSGGWTDGGTVIYNTTATDKVGIGTTAVPHGAVGYALLALEGTDGNAAGPHVQFTTAADDYPVFQQLNWTHDNVALNFDSYFDGAWRSSDAGSSFQIYKISDLLRIRYGVAAAGAAVTWNEGIVMNSSGNVGVGTTTAPGYPFHVYRDTTGWLGRFENTNAGGASVYLSHGGGYGAYIDAGSDAGSGTYALNVNKSGTSYLYVRGDGNIGISSTIPGSLLTVGATGQFSVNSSGTVTAGAWNGTAVAVAYGGTGQTTATAAFNALDPLTTKGDLVVHDGTNSVRLAVGTNDYVLTADSTQASGVKWAAAPGGGSSKWTDGGATTYLTSLTDNVGIGTTSAASKLDLRDGDITLDHTVGTGAPEVIMDWASAGAQKARLGSWSDGIAYLTANASNDGTNWNRDNTGVGAGVVDVGTSTIFRIRYAASGANPATLTTAMTVDSSGGASFDRHSKARAWIDNATQTISNNTNVKVAWNSESYDTLSEFDSTTNERFTATTAGYYMVSASVRWITTVDATDFAMDVYLNGGGTTRYCSVAQRASGTAELVQTATDVVYLAANDYLELFVWHNSGSDRTIGADTNAWTKARNHLTVHRLP